MTKTKVNFLFPLFCLVLCLLFPAVCAAGVRKGLSLSLDAALPSLFPSLVLSGLLTRSTFGQSKKSALLTPFFLGLFCGFPVGAAAVCNVVESGRITRKDGEKMLLFCNNAGPAFLISFCGERILSDPRKGAWIFLFQSAISAAFFLIFFAKDLFGKEKTVGKNALQAPAAFWKHIPAALKDGSNSFLYIMSCVIFFSFLTELILYLFPVKDLPAAVLHVFTELCGGMEKLQALPCELAFPLCACACGWGGISVHLQTAGILENSPLSIRNHVLGKGIFAVLLFLLTLFFQKLL